MSTLEPLSYSLLATTYFLRVTTTLLRLQISLPVLYFVTGVFFKDGYINIFHPPSSANVMLIFLHWKARSLSPPFSYVWTSHYGRSDPLWPLGLCYKRHYDCSLILLEHLPWSSPTVCMCSNHNHSGEPSHDTASCLPGSSATPECSGDELSLTELCLNSYSRAKNDCLKPLAFGIICYAARGN